MFEKIINFLLPWKQRHIIEASINDISAESQQQKLMYKKLTSFIRFCLYFLKNKYDQSLNLYGSRTCLTLGVGLK